MKFGFDSGRVNGAGHIFFAPLPYPQAGEKGMGDSDAHDECSKLPNLFAPARAFISE
jgi:hypothetical protein